MSFVGSSNMSSLSLTSSSPLAALSDLGDTSTETAAPPGIFHFTFGDVEVTTVWLSD